MAKIATLLSILILLVLVFAPILANAPAMTAGNLVWSGGNLVWSGGYGTWAGGFGTWAG